MALQHLTLTSLTENIPLTTTEYCVRARTQRTPSVPTRQTCQDKNPTSVAKHRLTGGSTWQNQGQWSQCGRWECMKSNYEGVKETKGIRKTNTHTSLSSFMGFFFFLSVQGQEIRPRRNYSRSTVIHLGRWWGALYIYSKKDWPQCCWQLVILCLLALCEEDYRFDSQWWLKVFVHGCSPGSPVSSQSPGWRWTNQLCSTYWSCSFDCDSSMTDFKRFLSYLM